MNFTTLCCLLIMALNLFLSHICLGFWGAYNAVSGVKFGTAVMKCFLRKY